MVTAVTTTLTGLFIESCFFVVFLPRLTTQGTGRLGHVLLGLSWVELFVLLCDKKVT